MQKKSSIVIIVIAVICGLAGVYFISGYVNSIESTYRERPMKTVVVAAQNISEHVFVTRDMLQVTSLPAEYVLPQTYERVEDLVGTMTVTQLHRGEQILQGRTSRGDTKSGFSYGIAEGQRAVSVAVNPVSGVSGLIGPKDRVDVLVTLTIPDSVTAGSRSSIEGEEPEKSEASISWEKELQLFQQVARKLLEDRRIVSFDGQRITFTLFQNIEVLAVGTKVTRTEGDRDNEGAAGTITLGLDPEAVELLTNAEAVGILKFDLRNPGDEEIADLIPIIEYNLEEILGS